VATSVIPPLPTSDEIHLTNYRLGYALSDLEHIVSVLEKQTNTVTIEQYVDALADETPLPKPPPLDQGALARIVVFATDMIDDSSTIDGHARKILELARALYHEQHGGDESDPESYASYRRAIREWHEHEAATEGDDA
jgi:hypothetical protein